MKIWVGPVRKPRMKKPFVISPEPSRQRPPASTLPNQASLKTTDFVLVYLKSALTDASTAQIETFIHNLEQKGFHLESAPFSLNDDITFVKIHAPRAVLLNFAEIFNVELAFQNVEFKVEPTKPFKFMATELTDPDPESPNYHRARDSFSGASPRSITNAEKGLVIYKALSRNPYGEDWHEYGVDKMIGRGVLDAAFPLHDGPHEWTSEGLLNDRQLLARFWSNVACWCKQQPLDLIERYYGPEIAFYFAWLGFYNRMLVPASAAGLLFFFLGILIFPNDFYWRSKEVCESEILLCPRCIVENCKYQPLNTSCFHSKLIYLFDNPLVITFAGLMSVWSTLFLELWRREEAMLQIRWNLRFVQTDCSLRPEFEEKTPYRRLSTITGQVEPYMPLRVMCYRYAITFSAILFLGLLMALGIFGVLIYVKTISVLLTKGPTDNVLTMNVGLVASASGSLMSVLFILMFDLLYEKVAMWLTTMENPRTQVDFDNSFTYKSYAIAFVNNYCVIFYIAFVKARFYTYPGDAELWSTAGGIGSDMCDPAGCIVELGIQLVVILLAKNLILTAKQYIIPRLLIWINRLRKRKTKHVDITLQWERDYMLNAVVKYQIMGEYMQMIIQYGFVTFFVAAFPPAPLLALFNNLIELRVDAFKMTQAYRRPIALKVPNLAAWDGILQGATYIGVATNAFVIAFTSEFVQRLIYKYGVRYDLKGYVNTTLSAYDVSEFPMTFEPWRNVSTCHYPGKRYPPDHPQRYVLTDEYWYDLTIKFLAVVLFEHLVMMITGIVAYVIPDIPFSVKEHINHQQDQFKEIKLKSLRDTYIRDQAQQKTDIFDQI